MTDDWKAPKVCECCGEEFSRRPREGRMLYERRRACSPECSRAARVRPPAERFWEKVAQVGDCWEWQGMRGPYGHGKFMVVKPQMIPAHRWSYTELIGPIPGGLVLDHLCRNTSCVNPWHLDPVPAGINTRRGESPPAQNSRKIRCHAGHLFDISNTRLLADGSRVCRACDAERARVYRTRKKAS